MKNLLPACLLLALASAPLAAAPHWTALGPFGGFPRALTLDPTNPKALYATTELQGTYRTLNGGVTWVAIQALGSLNNVAVDPSRPTTLYLSVNTADRILKSRDRGVHWAPANAGLPAGSGGGPIAVDPAQPSRVYAGIAGVWHSRDRGASWQPSRQPLPASGDASVIRCLVALLRPAGTVFAGTLGGLFRSVDGGDTWSLLANGLPAGQVFALAVAPSDPRVVWVALRDTGLYYSLNGGASWQQPAAQPGSSGVLALAVSPLSPRTLWAGTGRGLFRSADGGAHWSATGLPAQNVQLLAAGGRNLYAGLVPDPETPLASGVNLGGVLVSRDEGQTWQVRNQGFADLVAFDLAIDPESSLILLAAMGDSGIFRSARRGLAWTDPEQPPPPDQPGGVFSLAFGADRALYAVDKGDVWISNDLGALGDAWSVVLSVPHDSLLFVRADPRDLATLYTATSNTLYASHDRGAPWQLLDATFSCFLFDLAVAPSLPTTLYAAGADAGAPGPDGLCLTTARPALYRSTDGGTTWARIDAGLPGSLPVLAVAVDPADPLKIYIPLGSAVWRSRDGGATWAAANVSAHGLSNVAVSPGSGTVWAATVDSRVFASHDGGVTWQSTGGPLAYSIQRLVPDPHDPGRLYAATLSGIWVFE